MTIKRILQCTLMCLVLVASGCGFWSDEASAPPTTNPSPSVTPKDPNFFAEAAIDVGNAGRQLTSATKNTAVKPVKDSVKKAIQKLGENDSGLRALCTDCTEPTKDAGTKVLKDLNQILGDLGPDEKTVSSLDENLKQNLQQSLQKQFETLKHPSTAEPQTAGSPSPTPTPTLRGTRQDTADPWWGSTLILSAEVIGGVLIVVLLVSAVVYLWKHSWKTVEANVGQLVKAHVIAFREAQPDHTTKLSSLASTQAEMNSRLSELDTEMRSLARFVRESLTTRRSDGNNSSSGMYQSRGDMSPKDEPEFPVSAVDYLGKMNRFANVVRPDFQNGILVNDPDGTGELVLIRDSRDESQPLFVVPRATQFHTKQDFYTYYQKYYDCPRPTAGDVWIIGPAVVEKVTGGWQLREKGMLEIR